MPDRTIRELIISLTTRVDEDKIARKEQRTEDRETLRQERKENRERDRVIHGRLDDLPDIIRAEVAVQSSHIQLTIGSMDEALQDLTKRVTLTEAHVSPPRGIYSTGTNQYVKLIKENKPLAWLIGVALVITACAFYNKNSDVDLDPIRLLPIVTKSMDPTSDLSDDIEEPKE